MKLIVGLGNPGEKYKNNRHNIGFQFINYLIENLQIPNSKFQFPNGSTSPSALLRVLSLSKDSPSRAKSRDKSQISNNKFQKHLSSIVYHLSSDIILANPQTFMNNSGAVVKKLLSNFQTLKLSNLIVIHDDLDIPLGKFKIQKGVGPKLHNGIQSIEKELGRKDFWRVRIGVDNRQPESRIDGETYVLWDFKERERKIVEEVFEKVVMRLFYFLDNPSSFHLKLN